MEKKKKTIYDFWEMKKNGEKITYITAYDTPFAKFAEEAGSDLILVGDSFRMCQLGNRTTVKRRYCKIDSMDSSIEKTEAVTFGAQNTFVVADMPFLSYQVSVSEAIRNAGRFLEEAGADAIKLEGGEKVLDKIEGIIKAGIAVMAHIGFTPQSSDIKRKSPKVHGKTVKEAKELIKDALALQEAEVFAILLEAMPPDVGLAITKACEIPVLGIGAGPYTDGQLLIIHDVLGLLPTFNPKFVKKYLDGHKIIVDALKEYVADVRERKFPEVEKHCYWMEKGAPKDLLKALSGQDSLLPFGKKREVIQALKKIIKLEEIIK